MKHFSLFVLCLLTIVYLEGSFGWDILNSKHQLAKCLQNMIIQDNSSFVKHVRLSIASNSKTDIWKFGDIVDDFLSSNDFDMVFEIRNNNTEKRKEFTIHRRIMFVNSFEAFERLVKLQRSHATNVSGLFQYFYVILQPTVRNVYKVIQLITQFCLENLIANINILVENEQGYVTIYSYYPFTQTSCNNSKPIVYNYYKNDSFAYFKPIFPSKLANLWKCPLKIIAYELPPFIQNIEHPDRIFGVDVSVLQFLASRMNLTWQTVVSPNRRGEVYSNGTTTHGLKMLYDRKGDIMLAGACFNVKRLSHFSNSRNYFQTKLQLIIKPLEKHGSLSILLFPFDQSTWLTVLIVFAGKFVLFRILSKFQIKYQGISSKVTTVGWFLGILIIRSSYEGSIYKFLRNSPRKKLPESLSEAIADGYIFVTTEDIYNFCVQWVSEIDNNHLKVFNVSANEMFIIFSKLNGKYALIANAASFTIATKEMSKLRGIYRQWIILREPLLTAFTTMYMPKYSFLTSILNSFIEKMASHGIIRKIEKDFVDNAIERIRLSAPRDLPQQMSMQNLFGAFQLLAAMMCLTSCIFLMEIISVRNKKVKRLLNLFH